MAELQETVIRSIAKVLSIPEEDVCLTDNLHDDLGVDSLDEVQIAMELEDVLEITFPDSEFDVIKTVQHVVDAATTFVARGGK